MGPVNSPHKGPVMRKIFPFDDVIMGWWIYVLLSSAIITWSSKTWYCVQHCSGWSRTGIRVYTHKIHPISCLYGRCDMAFIEPMHRNIPNITYLLTCLYGLAMGCLLWWFWRRLNTSEGTIVYYEFSVSAMLQGQCEVKPFERCPIDMKFYTALLRLCWQVACQLSGSDTSSGWHWCCCVHRGWWRNWKMFEKWILWH